MHYLCLFFKGFWLFFLPVVSPALSVRRGKMKETFRFLPFLHHFSSFFPIFSLLSQIFPSFSFSHFFFCFSNFSLSVGHSAPMHHPTPATLLVPLFQSFLAVLLATILRFFTKLHWGGQISVFMILLCTQGNVTLLTSTLLRVHSQIPVLGLTGRARSIRAAPPGAGYKAGKILE